MRACSAALQSHGPMHSPWQGQLHSGRDAADRATRAAQRRLPWRPIAARLPLTGHRTFSNRAQARVAPYLASNASDCEPQAPKMGHKVTGALTHARSNLTREELEDGDNKLRLSLSKVAVAMRLLEDMSINTVAS